eukprot:3015922-Pyramimonas_sp.AAC.1
MGLIGLGSVSDYLVHYLHCPVLVVRKRDIGSEHIEEETEETPATAAAAGVAAGMAALDESTSTTGMPESDVAAATTARAIASEGVDIISALRDASIQAGAPDSANDENSAASMPEISEQVKSPSASPEDLPITKADMRAVNRRACGDDDIQRSFYYTGYKPNLTPSPQSDEVPFSIIREYVTPPRQRATPCTTQAPHATIYSFSG